MTSGMVGNPILRLLMDFSSTEKSEWLLNLFDGNSNSHTWLKLSVTTLLGISDSPDFDPVWIFNDSKVCENPHCVQNKWQFRKKTKRNRVPRLLLGLRQRPWLAALRRRNDSTRLTRLSVERQSPDRAALRYWAEILLHIQLIKTFLRWVC